MAYYLEICLEKLVSIQVSLLKVLCKFSKFYPFKLVLWVKAILASVALLQMLPFSKNLLEQDCHTLKYASLVSLWMKSLLLCAQLLKFIQNFETRRCSERNSLSQWACACNALWKQIIMLEIISLNCLSISPNILYWSIFSNFPVFFWYLPQGSQGHFVNVTASAITTNTQCVSLPTWCQAVFQVCSVCWHIVLTKTL